MGGQESGTTALDAYRDVGGRQRLEQVVERRCTWMCCQGRADIGNYCAVLAMERSNQWNLMTFMQVYIVRFITLGYPETMRTLLTMLCLTLAMTTAAEVYRSVDENGNVLFTDQPSPDAELIEVDELQTIKPPPIGDFEYTPPPAKPKPKYSNISITSPQHDASIRDNGGNVTVNITTQPGLRANDNLVLYLDGKEILLGKSTAKAFSSLDRGSHQLRAVIKDDSGRIQLSSQSVTFHLLRQSVR